MNLTQPLTVLLPLLYFLAASLYGMAYAGDKQPTWSTRAQRSVLLLAMTSHLWLFWVHAMKSDVFPVQGVTLTISAVALTTAMLFRFLTIRAPQASVGSLVLGCVGCLQLIASAFGPMTAGEGAAPRDAVAILHILMMLLASAALILSGVYGWLHLVQYRQMRRRVFGSLFRNLPSLELLSSMVRRTALAGFACLTLGLNVGIGLGHARPIHEFRYKDPQVILIIGLWIYFGVIAFSRRIPGLNARRASTMAIGGLLALLTSLALMATNLSFHAS
jgi:ABC-type uncharacterized transport system permease subunit